MDDSEEIRENEIITVVTLPNGKEFPRKKYSEYTKEELIEIIGCCKSIKDIILTLKINRYYHSYISKFIKDNTIGISHFSAKPRMRLNMDEVLCKNGKYIHSSSMKSYLIKNKLVENKCSVCNIPPVWNNMPMTLQLDHINGDHYDNSVENLRLICPNCHSQTDTYTGRNLKQYDDKHCSSCNKKIRRDNMSLKCLDCIKKDSDKCTICNIRDRVVNNSKCTPCSKLKLEPSMCKECGEVLKKQTTASGYHKRCFTLTKKSQKDEE